MLNTEIAALFQQMAEMLEFLGDPNDRYRILAYQNVARTIESLPENLERLARQKKLTTIRGIGTAIAQKIEEYIASGKMREHELMRKKIPAGIFELFEIPSLGPKRIRKLYGELGIDTIEKLQQAIAAGKVQSLPGFGEKSAQKMLDGIALKQTITVRRPIGDVFLVVQELLEFLKKQPAVHDAVAAGSFRRGEQTVGDIDILATGDISKSEHIMKKFVQQARVREILGSGETKSSVVISEGIQVDLRLVKPSEFGSALQYFTGSKQHNVALRTIAKSRGFKISEYGFFQGNKKLASKTEEQCYASLGMQYIPPEIRQNTGEIEAALQHKIPKLIELSDMHGDLHTHSRFSDGNNTIEEMAIAAQRLGYEYIALTDHSPSLTIAHGLKRERLSEKKREIEKLQSRMKIHILFGTEVDILADGSIDYPDEILKQFDIVVASIHSRFNQDNTERLIAAMENPFVDIIGHPSGRLIGRRKSYELDYERVFRAASETGTVLEINAQHLRLDLQDVYIREAKRWKCKFSIDSDAHTTQSLGLMDLGVKWARRGWCEAVDVVNTLPLSKLRQTLRRV